MKSQNEFLPRSLAILPMLDFFNPGGDPTDGGGATLTDFDTVDFQMVSSSASQPGVIINYSELKMDSPADGGTVPISAQDETERVMLLVGLPKPSANWSMSLQLSGPQGNDVVQMRTITSNFATLRAVMLASNSIGFEVEGLFFTIKLGNESFETYLNINQKAEVVKLNYTNESTFDMFRVSFLAISNVPNK